MANVEVRGMDTLRRVLDNAGNLPPTLMRDLQQFVTQRAMAIEAEAVRRAPIDQGTLRRSSSTDVSLMGELRAQIMFGGMAAANALAGIMSVIVSGYFVRKPRRQAGTAALVAAQPDVPPE